MKLVVVGLGYVGTSLAVLISKKYEVIAVDIDDEKVKKINKRISPIQDAEIEKFLNNKSLKTIKEAQREAFVNILKKNEIPFREFKIKDFSEETLGELFSYFMLETAIIGKLSNLNPYNQPAVEEVKINTRKLLI